MWVNRFQYVSLDPIKRPTWDKWVNKIKLFIQGDVILNIEENIDIE